MSVTNAVRNPRAYLGGVWQTYRTVLFDPGSFFEDLDERGIRKEFLLVAVIGIVGAIGPFYAFQKLMSVFCTGPFCQPTDPTLTTQAPLRLRGKVAEPILYTFGIWVGFALAFYVVSWLYGERGGVRHMVKNTAWGMVPLFFANLIKSIGYVVATVGVDVEGNLQTDPNAWFSVADGLVLTSDVVQTVWGQVSEDPATYIATGLSLVFLVWAGYIWAHGIADVRRIDLQSAYRVAAVPTAVYAVLVLVQIATRAGLL